MTWRALSISPYNAAAFDLVKAEMEGQSLDLIECLSGRIAAGILREFPMARREHGVPGMSAASVPVSYKPV